MKPIEIKKVSTTLGDLFDLEHLYTFRVFIKSQSSPINLYQLSVIHIKATIEEEMKANQL